MNIPMLKVVAILLICSVSIPAFSQFDYAGSGRALKFDGIDDYVDFGNIYDDLALPVSISAWVNVAPGSTGQLPIFVSQEGNSVYNGFWLVINATHLFCGYGDGLGFNSPAYRREMSLPHNGVVGEWIHVAAVIKGPTDMTLYINGITNSALPTGSTDNPMSSFASAETAHAGVWTTNNSTYHFDGAVDELTIWNIPLSQERIRTQMCRKLTGTEDGLIGYWNFDETQGETVNDQSGKAANGIIVGCERIYSGAAIGNESVFEYGTTSSEKSFGDFTIKNITGSPLGIQLYKVNSAPSQTNGLSVVPVEYYGAFLIRNVSEPTFENNKCIHWRTDNSNAVWDIAATTRDYSTRAEIISTPSTDAVFDLGDDIQICAGEAVTISSNLSSDDFSFHWSNGQTTESITINKPGEYVLTVDGECGSNQDSVKVSLLQAPPAFKLPADTIICAGNLVLKPDHQSDDVEFKWSTGETKSEIQINKPGVYMLTMSNHCGESTDEIKVSGGTSIDPGKIPNVITPNRDGKNDSFVVEKLSSDTLIIHIFNRWGRLVFASDDYKNDWRADDLASGEYYYVLNSGCGGNFKGTITVLK